MLKAYPVPLQIDREIAHLKLANIGIRLDKPSLYVPRVMTRHEVGSILSFHDDDRHPRF
ncbi:MAG: hypothetical protein HZA21_05240 [Nitrospirae bacterium]|nr:hypothetical protein [Nitrospirota bacterium]